MRRDEFSPKPDLALGKYQHYKGNFYEVFELACHSETHEWYVVYKSPSPKENTPNIWIRPYEMFIQNVRVDGTEVPRFKKIDKLGTYNDNVYQ